MRVGESQQGMRKGFSILLTAAFLGGCIVPPQAALRSDTDARAEDMAREQHRLALRMDELAQGLIDVKARLDRIETARGAGAPAAAPPVAAREVEPLLEVVRLSPPPVVEDVPAPLPSLPPPPALPVKEVQAPKPRSETPPPAPVVTPVQAQSSAPVVSSAATVAVPVAPAPSISAPPPPAAPSQGTDEASKLYQRAYSTYKQGQYARAILDFEEFVQKFPDHDHADSAQYWIGESYFSQGEYDQAIVEFNRVVDRYPGKTKAPEACLMIGTSYEKLGQADLARTFYRRLIAQYPQSEAAFKAEKKLLETP